MLDLGLSEKGYFFSLWDSIEKDVEKGDLEGNPSIFLAEQEARENLYYGKVLDEDTREVVEKLDEHLKIFDIQRLFLINLVQPNGVQKISWMHIALAIFGGLMASYVALLLGAKITDVLMQEMVLKVQLQVIALMIALIALPNIYLAYISTAGPLGYRQYLMKVPQS